MSLSKALDIHIVIADVEEFSRTMSLLLFSFLFGFAYTTSYEDFKPKSGVANKSFTLVPGFIAKLFKKKNADDSNVVQSAAPSRLNLTTGNLRVPESADTPPNYWLPDELLFVDESEKGDVNTQET